MPVGGVVVAAGPRAAQAELLARLDELLAPLPQRPELLARPVLIVVPSATLRTHVLAALAQHRRGGVAGVVVRTLLGVARDVAETAAAPIGPLDEALLPVMVERFAAREPALAAALGGFEDAFGSVTAAVRDLLDAGLEPEHVEALEERLAECARDDAGRAQAVVRVAAKAALALAQEGVHRPAGVLRRAAELLRAQPQWVRARAVLIYGFADVTAVAGDLLEALVRWCGATVLLDEPPDPVCRAHPDAGAAFTARLRQRLASTAAPVAARQETPAPHLEAFYAVDAEGEAREVARRVRALLDAGCRPEAIAVVARNPAPYREALERQLGRRAVPHSWAGMPGPWVPWAVRVRGALALLREGADTPVEVWLQAAEGEPVLLRLACRAIGVRRLGELATLDVAGMLQGRAALPLPLAGGAGEDGAEGVRQRRLGAEELYRAVRRAGEAVRFVARWEEPARRHEHDKWLRRLIEVLRWRGESDEATAWRDLLGRLAAAAPATALLLRRELHRMLERMSEDVLRPPGESGGGICLAPVMEVRGCTFEHLFVVGLNRGVFPRRGVQDPVVPDRLRAALLPLLPDLPLKGDTSAEERHLFAQLCEAAGTVTFSWRKLDERGTVLAPSPLLARVSLPAASVVPWESDDGAPLEPFEAVQRAALSGDRAALAAVWTGVQPDTERQVVGWRLAVLDEQEPDAVWHGGNVGSWQPGPYLGFLGRAPRSERSISVSMLEALARCPWQAFVARVLGVEPPPDPEARIGELDARAVGIAVHRALALLLGAPASRAHGAPGRTVQRPSDDELSAAARQAAAEVAREGGWLSPAIGLVAAPRVQAFLEVARELLWSSPEGNVAVTAVEMAGSLATLVNGEEWEISYRADLAETEGERARLTDFKTGRNPFGQKRQASQISAHLEAVERGERLQAAVYAAACGGTGRYLFLHPEQAPEMSREASLAAAQAHPSLIEALTVLIRLWVYGAMFPRLASAKDGREPRACQVCEVREACWRGDAGVRARLVAWAAAAAAEPDPVRQPAEAALLAAWRLTAGRSTEEATE